MYFEVYFFQQTAKNHTANFSQFYKYPKNPGKDKSIFIMFDGLIVFKSHEKSFNYCNLEVLLKTMLISYNLWW